ncbi:MAG: hypothetical protein HQ483_21230 [Rhodospirillales bacterium]|nr:hypothetical protein [Rhodospirillales bacterium]
MQGLIDSDLVAAVDRVRTEAGYLNLRDLLALAERGNIVFDPFSTLISQHATIGANNRFYPNTLIECPGTALCSIGDGNQFFANTRLDADRGPITIGNHGRYRGHVSIFGNAKLGDGCQVLGMITVRDCTLLGGQSYSHAVADERGAVLKGYGDANNIDLGPGEVIRGNGTFLMADKKKQSWYHPTEV